MKVLFFIGFVALITATIQATIYLLTKRKSAMIILPIACAIPTIYILLNYGNTSILSNEAELYLGSVIIGIPAFIVSSLTGIIITRAKSK